MINLNILIVSPFFYPYAGVGAIRMSALADYLMRYENTEITVLKNKYQGNTNSDSYYKNLSKVNIIDINASGAFDDDSALYKTAIIDLCGKCKFDLIIYTCGPFYAMKIACDVKRETGIPYYIDLRDDWDRKYAGFKQTLRYIAQYPLKRAMQLKTYRSAQRVIVISDMVRDEYAKRFPSVADKFSVIFNGFDDQIIESEAVNRISSSIKGAYSDNCVKIGICGKFVEYSQNYSAALFSGMELYSKKYGRNVRLFHMGSDCSGALQTLHINGDLYNYMGYGSHGECLDFIGCMDITVIVSPDKDTIGLGTKIWDYMYLDKPIMYIGPKNTELSDYLGENICSGAEDICECINTIVNTPLHENAGCEKLHLRSVENEKYLKLIKRDLTAQEQK